MPRVSIHIIYTPKETGVLIVRVLHTRMDIKRHFGKTGHKKPVGSPAHCQ